MKMLIRYVAILGWVVLLAGCTKSGQAVAPVTGRITLDGKPVEFAIVTFQAEGKSAASSSTDKDGRYDLYYKRGLRGAPVGPNRVTILLDVYSAPKGLVIPPKYNSESKLHADVQPGPNAFDFDLTTAE